MVVSVESNATRAGTRMLELGGNAVDAAVAVAFALAVTHPTAGNLGGGGFVLVKRPGEAAVGLDFRERAPRAVTQENFERMLARGASGPSSVGVPGTVAGLLEAHARWGKLPRAAVLQPAIDLARDGHALGERQAKTIRWAWADLKRDPESRRIFGRPASRGGGPLRAGELLVQPDLARTLERLRDSGQDDFYRGQTAQAIDLVMRQRGGLVSLEDLGEYVVRERAPLSVEYRGVHVETLGPPSAGSVAVIEMLAMFERLEAWKSAPGSAEALHLFAEVARRAQAERRFGEGVVDPDTAEQVDVEAAQRRWRRGGDWLERFPIEPERASRSADLHPLPNGERRESYDTTHLSTADADGWVVSCTTTLSRGFGARFVVPGTGVLMNNSLAAFSVLGSDLPKPGRRMASSMSPTLVSLGDAPVLVLGSPGGDTIPNTVVQVLRNLVDYQMPLDQAIESPRVHHGFVPDELQYEATRPPSVAVRAELRRKGHILTSPRSAIGDANSILVWQGVFWGHADTREGGLAAAPAPPP